MRLTEYERENISIDKGSTTKRMKRQMSGKPDVWYLTYASSEPFLRGYPCPYILEFIRSSDGFVCFWLGSYDLDELIEEARARGVRGVRGVV